MEHKITIYHKHIPVGKNWHLEIQIDKFPDAWFTFVNILITTHQFVLSLLGLELSAEWMCSHPQIKIEWMSFFGHYAGINLYTTSVKYHD